jgi:hypothetical protein
VNRREFIVTAAGTLCAPLAVWAQQPGRLFRTGWLDYSSAAENLGIFVQAMSGRGWVQDKNFRIEYRGGEAQPRRIGDGRAGRGVGATQGSQWRSDQRVSRVD